MQLRALLQKYWIGFNMGNELFINSVLVITLVFQIVVIVFYFKKFRYLNASGLSLLGIYLVLPLFTLLGAVIAKIFCKDPKHIVFLFENIITIFQFAVMLLIYSKQHIVKNSILWFLFIIFSLVWLMESQNELAKHGIEKLDRLRITGIFASFAVIIGVLIYWINIFQRQDLFYRRNPFFWVSLGWFIFYLLDCFTYIPFIASLNMLPKKIVLGLCGLNEIINSICYLIAFNKVTRWVSKGFARK